VALFGDAYGTTWVLTGIAVHALLALVAGTVATLVHEGQAHWAAQ
jgi:hypothetical protein